MKWQPIETAPKGGINFLVYTTDINCTFQAYRKQNEETFFCWRNGDDLEKRLAVNLTHWMPLPPPPEFDPLDTFSPDDFGGDDK